MAVPKSLVYRHQVVRTHVTIHEDNTGFFTRLQSLLDQLVHVRETCFYSLRGRATYFRTEFSPQGPFEHKGRDASEVCVRREANRRLSPLELHTVTVLSDTQMY